jgi:hypothetical protein
VVVDVVPDPTLARGSASAIFNVPVAGPEPTALGLLIAGDAPVAEIRLESL